MLAGPVTMSPAAPQTFPCCQNRLGRSSFHRCILSPQCSQRLSRSGAAVERTGMACLHGADVMVSQKQASFLRS